MRAELRLSVYPAHGAGVNFRAAARAAAAVLLGIFAAAAAGHAQPLACDPELTSLFTPAHPALGRYEVCTTPEPLSSVAPAAAAVERRLALDAFGTAGPYDRSRLARLYAGRRVQVAHSWTQTASRFESRTFISPYPDASLSRLLPGTLVIRFVLE